MTTALAAAEAALRHNVRPLTPAGTGSLERALVDVAGPAGTRLRAADAAGEAIVVEGLEPGQARALERAIQAEGGRAVIAPGGDRAVLVGPPTSLLAVASRLGDRGSPIGDLAAALAAGLPSGSRRTWLRCGQRRLELGARTLVMGIVNATPDSFSGDGVAGDVGAAVALAERMVADGADLIDVGGESTRPGSAPVAAATELLRVIPVVEALAARLPVPISVDTRKAEVALAAIGAGATMVNDIWGLRGDPQMAVVIAAHPEVALVAMHNRRGHEYRDLVAEVARDLRESLVVAARHGIEPERVVVDPGFGFGKTPAQNLELMRRLAELRGLGRPLLLGASRKSTIGLVLGGAPPELRVEGTLALCVLAVTSGTEMVRVHDVAGVHRGLRVADAVLRAVPESVRRAPARGPTG